MALPWRSVSEDLIVMKKFLFPEFKYSSKTQLLFNLYPFLKQNPPEHFIDRFLFGRIEIVNDDTSFYDSITNMFVEEVPLDFLHEQEKGNISEAYAEDIKYFCATNPNILALARYFWWDADNTPQGLVVTIMPDNDNLLFDFNPNSPLGVTYA